MGFDLMWIGLAAYQELLLQVFYTIIPLPKKTLVNEIAVVSVEQFIHSDLQIETILSR